MCVYPACAGIDLGAIKLMVTYIGLPRMRGDRPSSVKSSINSSAFTPHARGSTSHDITSLFLLIVYPACAGIDLCVKLTGALTTSLPRMRGDRPYILPQDLLSTLFTPHARGSTYPIAPGCGYAEVYPACAGIDPWSWQGCWRDRGLPRMRGDRPSIKQRDNRA